MSMISSYSAIPLLFHVLSSKGIALGLYQWTCCSRPGLQSIYQCFTIYFDGKLKYYPMDYGTWIYYHMFKILWYRLSNMSHSTRVSSFSLAPKRMASRTNSLSGTQGHKAWLITWLPCKKRPICPPRFSNSLSGKLGFKILRLLRHPFFRVVWCCMAFSQDFHQSYIPCPALGAQAQRNHGGGWGAPVGLINAMSAMFIN